MLGQRSASRGEHERLQMMFERAPGFMALVEPPDLKIGIANEAFLDLVHTYQQSAIDIAGGPRPEVEIKLVIGRVRKRLAGVERAARRTADEAAGGILARQLG